LTRKIPADSSPPIRYPQGAVRTRPVLCLQRRKLKSPYRPVKAFERQRPDRLGGDGALDRGVSPWSQKDLPALRLITESRGEVHDAANGAVLPACFEADLAQCRVAGRDANPEVQVVAALPPADGSAPRAADGRPMGYCWRSSPRIPSPCWFDPYGSPQQASGVPNQSRTRRRHYGRSPRVVGNTWTLPTPGDAKQDSRTHAVETAPRFCVSGCGRYRRGRSPGHCR